MIKIKNADGTWSLISGTEPSTPAVDNNTIQVNASQQLEVKSVPVNKIPAVGTANGIASLDSTGKVPSSQIPGAIDQIVEVPTISDLPATGESNKIYVTIDTSKTYRWGGTQYVEISASLALGETSATAYRGDRGAAAYAHTSVTTGNPHNVTKADIGLGNVDNTADLNKPISTAVQTALNEKANATSLTSHINNTSNPHLVTATQVGLGNCNNTADLDKPVSTATQAALNGKQDSLTTAQLAAANSGITSTKVTTYDGYSTSKANASDVITIASTLTSHTGNTSNPHLVTADQVGLGNVDNTSDADKPISDATQTALDAKSTVSVAATGTATDQVKYITVDGTEKKLAGGAKTFYQDTEPADAVEGDLWGNNEGGAGTPVWGSITGTMSDQTDLNTALGEKAPQATTYTKTEVDTALGGKVSTDALKDTIRDLFYPVGSHYIQIDSITPATRFGGTWEVDTTYNGKALWCDSTKTVGTAIAQALPKPTLTFTGSSATTGGGSAHTHTFTGSSATSGTQSANHTHTFTGSSVSTASNGSHTHTRGTMEIKGEARFSCVGDNGIHTKSGALNDSSYYKNDWGRKYESANYTSTGILNFTASNNWTGETSNNGSHSHTVTAAGSIGNNSVSHTHTVTAKGSNSSESSHTHSVTAKGSVTCDTAGAYGTGSVVQPPAISVVVWKRTA